MTTKTPPIPPTAPMPQAISLDTALGMALDAARLADPVRLSADGRMFVALPEGHRLHEVPDERRLAPFARALLECDDRASLVAYVNRYRVPATVLLADYDTLSVGALLDWHPASGAADFGQAGPARHKAILRLRDSEEFQRWDKIEGELLPQAEFAAFLEENSIDIAYPEAASMVEISRDLEGTVGQTFRQATRLENGDRQFTFTSETQVTNGVVVPREFLLSIPLFAGEPPDTLKCYSTRRQTNPSASPPGLTR